MLEQYSDKLKNGNLTEEDRKEVKNIIVLTHRYLDLSKSDEKNRIELELGDHFDRNVERESESFFQFIKVLLIKAYFI